MIFFSTQKGPWSWFIERFIYLLQLHLIYMMRSDG